MTFEPLDPTEEKAIVATLLPEPESAVPIEAVILPSDPASLTREETPPSEQPSPGRIRRLARWMGSVASFAFCFASLVSILSVLAAIPVLQLITLGYLLHVAGRISDGATVRESLLGLQEAGTIGMGMLALFLFALPTQLLADWSTVSQLVDPTTNLPTILSAVALASALLTMLLLAWAWVRGGRWYHYLWPQPVRFAKEAWRPKTWARSADRIWTMTMAFRWPMLFWLGLRAALATLVWLIPAMVIVAANRNGQTGLAGLIGVLSLILLGISMLYLPMLQVQFARENRLAAMFDLRQIRGDFARAPWAWLTAMFLGLVAAPIPLYLLKIEALPQELVWLPCLAFVAFMLPARITAGLALRRARRRKQPGTGRLAFLGRLTARLLMPVVVGVYLLFVYVSQYTSWNGLQTWIQQHAILVPFPFVGT